MDDAGRVHKLNAWSRRPRPPSRRSWWPSSTRARGQGAEGAVRSRLPKAIEKFKKAYPSIKEITAWNEVNRCQQGPRTEGQPREAVQAERRQAARQLLQGRRGRSSRAPRSPRSTSSTRTTRGRRSSYIKAFKKLAKPMPEVLGHPQLLRHEPLPDQAHQGADRGDRQGQGQVWATETGGIVRLGQSFPESRPRGQGAGLHVHDRQEVQGGSSASTSTSSTPAAALRAVRRRPDRIPTARRAGLHGRQEAQGAHLQEVAAQAQRSA